MSINTLCATFRRLVVGKIHTAAVVRYCSMQQPSSATLVASRLTSNDQGLPNGTELANSIKFTPGTLNIDFGMPTNGDLVKNIIEMPLKNIPPLQEPLKPLRPMEYDSPLPQISVNLPTNGKVVEKLAVRLITIRRKKMKKHKRRKLRKKMKFEWAKMRFKRTTIREKLFHSELISKIKAAQAFDAKEYVKERLSILNKEWIPRTYKGEILPLETIKKFRDADKAKREAKRNKPRITL